MDWFSILEPFLAHGSYITIFLVIVFSGVGLPIPEEATFITAGYIVAATQGHLGLMITISLAGLIIGDSLIYYLGKHYGKAILVRWPFCILFSNKVLARSRKFFAVYGSYAVFVAGFFAGVRAGTYFMAGSMRFPYLKFIGLDFMRAVLTCPISIWAGYAFGSYAEQWLGEHIRYIFGVIIIVSIVILIRNILNPSSEDNQPTNSENN